MRDRGTTRSVAGQDFKVTTPGRVYYPETGTTKADVIDYYLQVAEVMLPHLAGHPQTVARRRERPRVLRQGHGARYPGMDDPRADPPSPTPSDRFRPLLSAGSARVLAERRRPWEWGSSRFVNRPAT